MDIDNTRKFNGRADAYVQGRPGYAKALLDYLHRRLNLSSKSVFADIGSGTGKLAAQLLEQGYTVFAVEPNDEMRQSAERLLSAYPGFVSVAGTDAHTGLKEACVDYVAAAQAFHWFDAEAFKRECRRILRPSGRVILVYNSRDISSDVVMEIEKLCRSFCPEFKGFSGGMNGDPSRVERFFDGAYDTVSFENDLIYTRDGFMQRMLSASYALKPDDERYDAFISSVQALFSAHSPDGERLLMPNHTTAYIGRVS